MAALDAPALDLIFREARSRNGWAEAPISDDDIRAIYALYKFGPTAANSQPARVVWVRSAEAKDRLEPALDAGNKAKARGASAVAIVGYDLDFPLTMPRVFPHAPTAKDWFPDMVKREWIALRNSSLQGAYLMIAARALGWDCGPMSGFDNAAVDREFFGGTNIRSNFIVAIGMGTDEKLFARNPRLDFEETNRIL
jgi:3-hydroxypropanoate dehydrogenase